MGYDTIIKMPVIELSEGYSIGSVSENYGTFDILYNDKVIGCVTWHGYYYGRFYGGNPSTRHIATVDYIKGELAQQRVAEQVIAYHKLMGNLEVPDDLHITLNALMNEFYISSYHITGSWMRTTLVCTIRKNFDGTYTLFQKHGDGEFICGALQESVSKSYEVAVEHNRYLRK